MPGPFRRKSPTPPKPWYEQEHGARLKHDQQRLAQTFPGLVYTIDDKARQVTLEGMMTLRAECGVPTEIRVRVVFPANYPSQEPRAYDVEARFPLTADRHFYPDGQCCLWLPPDSGWNSTDPEGLCRWLEEVAVFFDRQLVLEAEGKDTWPGDQRPHGDAGYLQFVQEILGDGPHVLAAFAPTFAQRGAPGRNSSCPCGSSQKYKGCHLERVEEVKRRVGIIKLRTVFLRQLSNTPALPKAT